MAEYGAISEAIQKFGLAFDKKQIFEIVGNYVSRTCANSVAVFAYPESGGFEASVISAEPLGDEALDRIEDSMTPLLAKYCSPGENFEDGRYPVSRLKFESCVLRDASAAAGPNPRKRQGDIKGSLLIPIFLGNRVYSIFGIFGESELDMSRETASDMVVIGYMAAMSIKNHSVTRSMISALSEAERRMSEEAARASRAPALLALSRKLASQKTVDGVMDATLSAYREMFGVARVAIYSHNHHRRELVLEKASFGHARAAKAGIPEDSGVAGAAVQKGQPYFRRPYIDDTDEIAAIPLFGVSGVSSGAITLFDRSKKLNFEERDFELMWTIANMLSVALNLVKIQSMAESRIAEKGSDHKIIESLVTLFESRSEVASLPALTAETLGKIFTAGSIAAFEADPGGGLKNVYLSDAVSGPSVKPLELEPAAARSIFESSVAQAISGDKLVARTGDNENRHGGKLFLCLPVTAEDGRNILFVAHDIEGDGIAKAADRTLVAAVSRAVQAAFDSSGQAAEKLLTVQNGAESEICRQIQKKLVPKADGTYEKFEVASFCEPSQSPGGDLFDFIRAENGNITLLVADVSGKGVQSALISAMLRAQVRSLIGGYPEPRKLLHTLNNLICEDIDLYNFITLLLLQLSPMGGRAAFCNAGHNPVLHYVRDGDNVVIHESKNSPLGILKNMEFKEGILLLDRGDILLLHTNGLCDLKNSSGDFFGRERSPTSFKRTRARTRNR